MNKAKNLSNFQDVLKVKEEYEARTGNKIVYLTVSGSKLYGTDTPTSDLDVRGIFIPTLRSVLLKQDENHYVHDTNNSKEKNTSEDVDLTVHSIYSFFNQLAKSETGGIDTLFSVFGDGNIIYEDKAFTDVIRANYKRFLNKNMKSFIGYALGQTKRFGIKGARYSELDLFITKVKSYYNTDKFVILGYDEEQKDNTKQISEEEKLKHLFPLFEEMIEDEKFNHIKFVLAPGPRGMGSNNLVSYISILGKLFEGGVSIAYFIERVGILYEQFGNRTITVSKTDSKTDWKALSHSFRISKEVLELLETSFIKFPLKDATEIRDMKQGKIDVELCLEKIQDTLEKVDILLLNSDLPEESDREFMDELILGMLIE